MRRSPKKKRTTKDTSTGPLGHAVACLLGMLSALHVVSDLETVPLEGNFIESNETLVAYENTTRAWAYRVMDHAKKLLVAGEDIDSMGVVWFPDRPGKLRRFPRESSGVEGLHLQERVDMLNWLSKHHDSETISGFMVDNPPVPSTLRKVVVAMHSDTEGEFNLKLHYELDDDNWVKLPLSEPRRIKSSKSSPSVTFTS